MEQLGKKELLLRLFYEAQDFMKENLKQELEYETDFKDSEIQDILYWLAIILRDLMVITKKLREHHDEDYRSGGKSWVLNSFLLRIEELWNK